MRNKLLIILLLFCLIVVGGCEDDSFTPAKEENVIEERQTYQNKFSEELIPGQWKDYGIGDPFVMRFNGKYYLYSSTKNTETGIRGWVSDDLIHWQQAETQGLKKGYVSEDEITLTAYAPEVIYKNGVFYMITSPSGKGHYILSASSPTGPFTRVTDNFGCAIDGSFFIDDDESFYFTSADTSGIKIYKLNDDLEITDTRFLQNTSIGSWTEGPSIFKREGIYYLTFTGNQVISDSYRIGYSYSQDETIFNRKAMTYGDNILINTDESFKGLGHCSTVLGPDLDSYYMAYHNLESTGGPIRSFNINRMFFNGTQMIVDNQAVNDNYVPNEPIFSANDETGLENVNNFALSQTKTDDTFTVEYNLSGNNQKIVFSYIDDSNYSYVKVGQTIEIFSVINGAETKISQKQLQKTYDFSKLYTIRLINGNENFKLYFNNMNVINVEKQFLSGKIGYINDDNLHIYYTSYSNFAHGSSDNQEIKHNNILGNAYDLSDYKLSEESGLITVQSQDNFNYYNDIKELRLHKDDYIKYAVKISKTGFYGIEMTFDAKYCGKKVGIEVDDDKIIQVNVPTVQTDDQFVKVTITEIDLPQGTHYLKFVGIDEFGFTEFNLFNSCIQYPNFINSLDNYVSQGAIYMNSWKIKDEGHYALAGNRQLLYFGDDCFTDFTISADLCFDGETQTSTAGFILRADNPSFSTYDLNDSIQGYYVGINNSKVFISKYNYNLSIADLKADAMEFAIGHTYNLKVEVKLNTIEVYIDNEKVISYTDSIAYTHGRIGLYTEGAPTIYKNIKITK